MRTRNKIKKNVNNKTNMPVNLKKIKIALTVLIFICIVNCIT